MVNYKTPCLNTEKEIPDDERPKIDYAVPRVHVPWQIADNNFLRDDLDSWRPFYKLKLFYARKVLCRKG
mgnify:CR=1 FL=1